MPLTAQVGDVIKVDLFCSLGGEMAKELTVTKPDATRLIKGLMQAMIIQPIIQRNSTVIQLMKGIKICVIVF